MNSLSLTRTALEAIVIGVIATLATDLWLRLLQMVRVPPPSWELVGRWVAWCLRGQFVHRPISATPSIRGELAIGWAFHYAVGIGYAVFYLLIMRLGFGSGPIFISAMVFALALLIASWFVMQPALGFGFMATRTPQPAAVQRVALPAERYCKIHRQSPPGAERKTRRDSGAFAA